MYSTTKTLFGAQMAITTTLFLLLLIQTNLATPTTTPTQANQTQNDQQQQQQRQPNQVVFVDLLTRLNTEKHHTSKYSDTNQFGRNVVLRRGQTIDLLVQLARPYDKANDKLRLEFSLGTNPQLADRSLNYVPLLVDENYDYTNNNQSSSSSPPPSAALFAVNPFDWDARITSINGNQSVSSIAASNNKQNSIRAQVYIPANASVGIWQLKISSKIASTRNLQTFSVRDTLIYIIFNPWSRDDDVYLGRDDARVEYVLNEVGKIYIGTYSQSVGRKWTYGQFEPTVLPAVMHMLDRSHMSVADRASVVKVARAVSAIVNSHDDGGFLVGNWSGNYGDGLAPWAWTGSAPIFRKFVQQGHKSVKFGQCWVFGGVTTTTLRTLGIPARTISNFVSAHDTDFSLTVDKFYSGYGGEMSGVNGDSIWNFHVWSDAWMARRDLPAGFGGWQAIDATPQEQSMGKYQLGPAPLEAIKQGKVSFGYDVAFVYSEVNADLVHWSQDGRSKLLWRRTQVQGGHVGRKILTKMIGYIDDRSRSGTMDAEDIVLQYKYPDGSAESKRARAEATKSAGLVSLFSDTRRR